MKSPHSVGNIPTLGTNDPPALEAPPASLIEHAGTAAGFQDQGSSGKRSSCCAFVAVIAIGGMLAIGVLPRLRQNTILAQASARLEHHVTLVNTVKPTRSNGDSELQLPGNVQAIEETTINARTTGYLRTLMTDIGSRVLPGQTLAIIEAPDLDQELVQAKAEASKSRATTEQARANVVRFQANVTQAQSEVVRLQSNLAAARAELSHADARLLAAQGAVAEAEARLQQSRKKVAGLIADLQRSRSRMSLADKTYTRWKELAKGGAVSGQDLDESEASYDSSLAQVNSSQADVESGQADVLAAQAALRARNGDVDAAKADILSAKQVINAATAAVESGRSNVHAVSASVDAGRANVSATIAGVASSEANVSKYQTMRSFERVTAPFAGVITARNVDKGALINAGGTGSVGNALDPTTTVPSSGLFGIARTDVLRIQISVPQTYVTSIVSGQQAQVTVREYPGRVFTATVFHISGALDAGSRTLMIELRLKNPHNTLVPGMFAQVGLGLRNKAPLCRVPANTLVIDGNGTRVITVTTDHTLHFIPVQIGRDFGKESEITEGLSGNETLVTDPTDDLVEGEKVVPADATSERK